MSGYYTSNQLVAAIKRKAMLPENSETFTFSDFLAFSNEELQSGIVPTVLSMNEEYYVYSELVPLRSNKSSYQIPYRAVGGKLRDLFLRDNNGNLISMSRISPDDKSLYQRSSMNTNHIFFYLEGNNVVITPPVTASASGSLLFTYFIRPSDLVEENKVSEITNIQVDPTSGTTTYTVDVIPAGFSVLTRFDLLQEKPGHKIRNIDLLATAISANNKTITFLSIEVDSDAEVGDIIALAGECIIPQCPSEMHPVLAQRAAARCLEALGDTQGLTNANSKLQEMQTSTVALIDNRVVGAVQKVVNNRGLLGRNRTRGR